MSTSQDASEGLSDDSDPTYTHFAHRDEFLSLLKRVLSYDLAEDTSGDGSSTALKRAQAQEEEEDGIVKLMGAILDHYLPLPPLLDPALDSIIPPLMDKIGSHLHKVVASDELTASSSSVAQYTNVARLARLGRLVNWVVKVRGWKAVVPHFSPDIKHLPMLTSLLSPPATSTATEETSHNPIIASQSSWELRSVLLIWLSLVLTVPFSLSAFTSATKPTVDLASRRTLFPHELDISTTAQQVTLLAIPLLSRPGKESTLAALVLARLFSRPDSTVGLEPFFAYAQSELESGSGTESDVEPTFVIALLNLLALLPGLLAKNRLIVVRRFLENQMIPYLKGSRMAMGSGLIRKLAVKAGGRWWVTSLGKGAQRNKGRAVVQGPGILSKFTNDLMAGDEDEADFDPPDGLEDELDALMGALSDKDTIVRYSAAKYLSRLSILLPPSFSQQIVGATISLFAGTDTDPVIETSEGKVIEPGGSAFGADDGFGLGGKEIMRGESRWHGVCLAVAEMARRGLVRGELVAEAVTWVLKALTFDIRRANHSIGANVRDAAAYLVWSLSRACSPEALAPFAERLATKLICVAVLDREVGVRRAASAAFQEGVGRLGHFPHGISVLGLTDFYSVSVRRTAFLEAAPRVAQFEVYRRALVSHLHHITLRHWDPAVRSIGSRSLRMIAEVAGREAQQAAVNQEMTEMCSLETGNVHGAMLALAELSELFSDEAEEKLQILQSLSTVRAAALTSFQADLLLCAGCNLIAKATVPEAFLADHVDVTEKTLARFLELSMKSRSEDVQEAAALAIGAASRFRSCEVEVERYRLTSLTFITGLTKSSRAAQKQSYALALGAIDFSTNPRIAQRAIDALLSVLDGGATGGPTPAADIETRRYAIRSITSIASTKDSGFTVHEDTFKTIYEAVLQGLVDYTTDQRGDVGSWVRSASLASLAPLLQADRARDTVDTVLTQEMVVQTVAAILKQGVEKLDSIRETAGRALQDVLIAIGDRWEIPSKSLLQSFLPSERLRWQEPAVIYPAVMPALATNAYRSSIMSGLVLSIGSKLESTSRLSGSALAAFLHQQNGLEPPLRVPALVIGDLIQLLASNLNQNRIFVPTMSALSVLADAGVLDSFAASTDIQQKLLRGVTLATKAIPTLKNMERIMTSMRLITSLVVLHGVRDAAIKSLPIYLTHRYPTVRSAASERLYLTLENADYDMSDVEDLLLSTSWADSCLPDEAEKLCNFLLQLSS